MAFGGPLDASGRYCSVRSKLLQGKGDRITSLRSEVNAHFNIEVVSRDIVMCMTALRILNVQRVILHLHSRGEAIQQIILLLIHREQLQRTLVLPILFKDISTKSSIEAPPHISDTKEPDN